VKSIHQSTFFYQHIYSFIVFLWIEIIEPFLILEWALECISQHHKNKIPNFAQKKKSWIGENKLVN
jgi:hypothetical protein